MEGDKQVKSVKKVEDDEESFSNLTKFSVYCSAIFGYNIRQDKKHNLFCNICFIHTISLVSYYGVYNVLRIDFSTVQKIVLSLNQLYLVFVVTLSTLNQRLVLPKIRMLFKKAGILLDELPVKKQAARYLKINMYIAVFSSLMFVLPRTLLLIERRFISAENSLESANGNEYFRTFE
ncbi:hypothetical protein CHUAL_004158 [Chamberlinius hualienensis]